MKFTCEKTAFSDVVSNLLRSVSSKSTLAALEGIYIKSKEQQLFLTAYDLEMGMSTSIPAKVLEEGEIVVTAKLLFDIIRRMPSDTIIMETNERNVVTIKGGMAEYSILGIPAEDYPELPSILNASSFVLNQGVLKSMIDMTLFAVAQTDSKPVHMGSFFKTEQNALEVVSVDGYRLAMRTEQTTDAPELSFVVPGKTLSEVSKLLKDDETIAELQVSKKHIVFQINGYSVISRLLEGEFLDYNAAIPKNRSTSVVVSVRDFIDAIERTSLLISDRMKSPLRLTFEDQKIKIKCTTSIGKAYDEVDCKMEGKEIEIGFNNKYLLDALRACDCAKVLLHINGPLSPMKITPVEENRFLYLVLPVRLKNED